MKIKKWFDKLKEKNPYWSDIIIFNTCITDRSLTKSEIGKAFDSLVDKNDYQKKDRDDILEFAYNLASLVK